MDTEFQAQDHNNFYEKRRINLVRHMSFVIMIVAAMYTVLIFVTKVPVPPILYIGAFLGGLITYLLGQKKLYTYAKCSALIFTNIVVFAAASSETERTNIFLYFGATALASLVVFGYQERWKGFLFVILSALLYLITRLTDFALIPFRHFSESQITVFFIINVIVFTYVSAYITYVMLKTNFTSEDVLHQTNKKVIKQNEELIKANAELDQFMYSTSHDIRAPLSSLKGLIALSERTSDLAEIKEYLKLMGGSVKNLEKFTLNITDHYRNSRLDLKYERVNVKHLVDEIAHSLSLGENIVKYNFSIEQDDEIVTDRTRLRVVLSNIISNGLKYRSEDARLPTISMNYKKVEEFHIIEIADNGIGIGAEHIDKIFDMFYRASAKSQGSGLGLYIVKETIDKLKGRIDVSSELGKGTTFRISLPILELSDQPQA